MSSEKVTLPELELQPASPTQDGPGVPATSQQSTAHGDPHEVEQGRATSTSQEIAALKQGLASLKKQTEKRHKPWYLDYSKTVPIFISVATVAISIYTISLQRAEDVQKDVETLSETIGQIVDLRKENTEKMMSGGDPTLLQAESTLLNQKKLALQEKARVLLRNPKVGAQVSPAEMRTLAGELGYSGYVNEAEQMLQSSLKTLDDEGTDRGGSQNQIERAYGLMGLAYWEMINDRALDKGREKMQEAVEIFKKKGGSFSERPLIETYLNWSNIELSLGDIGRSRKELQEAQKVLGTMDPLSTDKPILGYLCLNAEQLIRTKETPVAASNPTDWYGDWNVRFDKPRQRKGSLRLNWNRQTNMVEAHVELFDGARLAEIYAGTGILLSASQLRIDWGQIFRIIDPLPQAQPNLGYSLFTVASPKHLKISSYLLGEPPALGTAHKTN